MGRCTGKREDLSKVVVSIPLVLNLEFSDCFNTHSNRSWSFSKTLLPLSSSEPNDGLVYDFVGLALYQETTDTLNTVNKLVDSDEEGNITEDKYLTPEELSTSTTQHSNNSHCIACFLGKDK
jgi:hypothetical protein